MGNFFTDNDDLTFYVERGIDWRGLAKLYEEGPADESIATYKELLALMGSVAADEVATRARQVDAEGSKLVDGVAQTGPAHQKIFELFRDMGVYGLCIPKELGGLGAPAVMYFLFVEMLSRADVTVMTHFGFHAGTAISLLTFSVREGTTEMNADGKITKTRWPDVINEIIEGRAWGSMDLTEPNAGSDLATLRTRAVRDAEGTWRLTGNKIFITSGHGKYHMVLAKTSDQDSLEALSLFLVPATLERDGKTVVNARVDRLEEKLGHHGSPTCSVVFDNSEAELIGKIGDGFPLMLSLMNDARLGVGFEGVGLAEAAHRAAKAYAAERVSMGQPIEKHPMIADYLDEMDLWIRGLRALGMAAVVAEETQVRLELKERLAGSDVIDAEARRAIKRAKRRVRHFTPLLKYLAAEKAVWIARTGMQIHGGNGYTKDYDAERYVRESLGLPVYEGTSQIQALMVLKDNIGAAAKDPQTFLRRRAAAKLRAVRATDPLERAVWDLESAAYSAQQHLLWRAAKDKLSVAMKGPLGDVLQRLTESWDPKRDFAHGMLHAERLTQILGDAAIARVLWEQARDFPERRELAERWVERAAPRVRYNLDLIHSTGDRLLAGLEASDAAAEEQRRA
jgi:3-(methylthio)propanoyl-CoA dehydrogenase